MVGRLSSGLYGGCVHQYPFLQSDTHSYPGQFEVEMQDNWYETTVLANSPHDIISVVDWASDSVLPIPEVPKEPATYNVFPWGMNDPTDGNRSIAKENYDSIASPIGWHSLPFANDPDVNAKKQAGGEFYRNTTTTWGNNVSCSALARSTVLTMFTPGLCA
jgi:extracellular elastinolytic metalloproteinase